MRKMDKVLLDLMIVVVLLLTVAYAQLGKRVEDNKKYEDAKISSICQSSGHKQACK